MTQTVFISGANRGLGLSLVKRFLREGFRVFAGIRRQSDPLRQLAQAHGEALTVLTLDVTQLDSVRAAARYFSQRSPTLDILINNAGVLLDTEVPLEKLDLSDDALHTSMDVNAFGALRVTQQFLPFLEKGRHKLVMNISSEAGSITDCWRKSDFAYSMSKAALNMQSKLLHNYLSPRGFRILAIQPGWMKTEMGGADAVLDPDASAHGLFRVAVNRGGETPDATFLDYEGQPLRW
jgi:NAD(P)-dependent dehydrogenase (short-subunit alcohol dehydrogenase family)